MTLRIRVQSLTTCAAAQSLLIVNNVLGKLSEVRGTQTHDVTNTNTNTANN